MSEGAHRSGAVRPPGSDPPGSHLATVLARTLDRSSPVPLYHQVSQTVGALITSGDLAAGSRIDNEVALSQRLALSRPTVRRALQELVDRGLLVRRRGIGTTVVQPYVNRTLALTSLHDDLLEAGREPSTRLLEHHVGPGSAAATAALGLPARAPVLTVRRLRLVDDEPLALMTNHVSAGLGLDVDRLGSAGLYQLFRELGISLRVAHQRVGARLASAGEARLLDERPRAALVTMERTAYDASGTAVEHGDHVYRASRYHFETTFVER